MNAQKPAVLFVLRDAALAALSSKYPLVGTGVRLWPWVALVVESVPNEQELFQGAPKCVGPFEIDEDLVEVCTCSKCCERRATFLGDS